jgi:hypothetical protein
MTAGNSIESLTLDDLTEVCPTCKGTGQDPVTAPTTSPGGFGRQVLGGSSTKCPRRRCRDGRIPNATGLMLLRFFDQFKGIELRDF